MGLLPLELYSFLFSQAPITKLTMVSFHPVPFRWMQSQCTPRKQQSKQFSTSTFLQVCVHTCPPRQEGKKTLMTFTFPASDLLCISTSRCALVKHQHFIHEMHIFSPSLQTHSHTNRFILTAFFSPLPIIPNPGHPAALHFWAAYLQTQRFPTSRSKQAFAVIINVEV